MTALENVAVPMELAGLDDPFGRARAELERVGLAARTGHYPVQLSGGEQQRIAIARALINKPAIIFADEPTGNLDSHNAQSIHELFSKLRNELQQTFVIVTHNEHLAKSTDRVIKMQDGLIIA